jgi:glycosyltransferase involved in cell wall biosynthesis
VLVAIETHPIQYHAPVYRTIEEKFGIPVTAVYASDFSIAGYTDAEFGTTFSWDTDLLSGYSSVFLARVRDGGARGYEDTSTRGLRHALAEIRPAAILLTGYSPTFHRTAFFEARRCGVPLLFRGETSDHAVIRSRLKTYVRRTALKWLYGQCSRLLYVGQRSKEHFRALGLPESKLAFSPYCVNTAPFQAGEQCREALRASKRQQLGIGSEDIVFLFSGKMSWRKGPDLLVSALRSLDPALLERSVLVFVGAGNMEDVLKSLAASAPKVRIVFAGFQKQSDLSPFYHSADLMVLPSRHSETWGLVVNEALHHGVPCVVSQAVGCAPDLIEPGVTGETAASHSVEALAMALSRAMTLIRRVDTRNRCRRYVSAYSVDNAAAGIAAAYNATAGPH